MYKCSDCGAVFEYPEEAVETHGLDTPPYERIEVCPGCFSTDFAVAAECECCGEWASDYFETKDGHIYCEDCTYHRRAWR